ncbi:MAG: hydrogenase iron-sulfur subunit [bacterium]
MNYEPKIIGFLCNWCSYAAADLAGTSRMKYPHNIRIIRVMCSARVDPTFVIKAFELGADGVLITGCHPPSDCHYMEGNYKTFRRFPLLQKMLSQLGIEEDRVRLEWCSAAEAEKFARVVKEFTNTLVKLGPLFSQTQEQEFQGKVVS